MGLFIHSYGPHKMARFRAAEQYSPDYEPEPEPDQSPSEQTRTLKEERLRSWAEIEPYLDKIPPIEADILTMMFQLGKHERDIGAIFGLTQAAISYRLGKAVKRIQFLREIPKISRGELREVLAEALQAGTSKGQVTNCGWRLEKYLAEDLEILMCYLETTSQQAAIDKFQTGNARVMIVWRKAVRGLKKASPERASVASVALEYLNLVRKTPALRTCIWSPDDRRRKGPKPKGDLAL